MKLVKKCFYLRAGTSLFYRRRVFLHILYYTVRVHTPSKYSNDEMLSISSPSTRHAHANLITYTRARNRREECACVRHLVSWVETDLGLRPSAKLPSSLEKKASHLLQNAPHQTLQRGSRKQINEGLPAGTRPKRRIMVLSFIHDPQTNLLSQFSIPSSHSHINSSIIMKHVEAAAATTSVCVQCGKTNTQALYKKFTGGTIQLSQCVSTKITGLSTSCCRSIITVVRMTIHWICSPVTLWSSD